MPELGPHASFIIWAYLGVLVGVAALILTAGIEARRVRSRLKALEARGYFRPAAKKPKMVDNLRAVLTRAGFAEPEVKVLRGVVASLDYFSPNEPRGAGYPQRKAKADRAAHPAPQLDDAPPSGGQGLDND